MSFPTCPSGVSSIYTAIQRDMSFLWGLHAWNRCTENSQAGHFILAYSQYWYGVKGTKIDIPYRSRFWSTVLCSRYWSNRPPLTLRMCPVDNILVHFGPEKSWVRVFLHEAVDFTLDFIETGWSGIWQALFGLFSCPVVNVHLSRQYEINGSFTSEFERSRFATKKNLKKFHNAVSNERNIMFYVTRSN